MSRWHYFFAAILSVVIGISVLHIREMKKQYREDFQKYVAETEPSMSVLQGDGFTLWKNSDLHEINNDLQTANDRLDATVKMLEAYNAGKTLPEMGCFITQIECAVKDAPGAGKKW